MEGDLTHHRKVRAPPRVQPSEPLVPRSTGSQKVEAAIRVGVDCFALVASLFGVFVTAQRIMTNAVRAMFNEAALDGLGYLAFLYNSAESAWQKASAVFKMLGVLWNAGAIKAMIGALRNTMKWWDWVLAALVLLAQLAALAVSEGLSIIGQIALVVLSMTTLAVDIYLLVTAFGTSPPQPNPRLVTLPRDLALAT